MTGLAIHETVFKANDQAFNAKLVVVEIADLDILFVSQQADQGICTRQLEWFERLLGQFRNCHQGNVWIFHFLLDFTINDQGDIPAM